MAHNAPLPKWSVQMVSIGAEDADILGRVPPSLRALNGIPEPEQTDARERAVALASEALADLLLPGGVRVSPLGPGWSRDIDLHLRNWPESARLEALGWLPLDALLRRLGTPGRGSWAVAENGRILAGLDLHLGPPPDPLASLLSRCRRRGEVRVREVLEARALLRAGYTLPGDDPIIRLAARVEAGLGGRALAPWKDGPPLGAPGLLPGRQIRRRLAASRSRLRPRLVVAVSGVDGSGKSTLIELIMRNLEQAGIPVGRVWARPGGTMPQLLSGLASGVKKLLGQEPSWASSRTARGASAGELTSRRGIVGWTWTMLVTLSFLLHVRRQHLTGRGILLYDRHLLDALVHLEFVYKGVDLGLHRAVVRRAMPKPALSVYLDVPAEVAMIRSSLRTEEPGDVYSEEYAVRRQLESYEANRGEVEGLRRLDGTRPADELAAVVTRWIAGL